ncbi:MAG: MerR family transcriptional regulator [Candidatus Omnitrophota bacterium]
MGRNNTLTITEVAEKLGVVPKTILRWEKSGKIKKARRDWRNWRAYTHDDVTEMENITEMFY